MWSHYTESHTGVCLEFSNLGTASGLGVFHPVEYRDDVPEVNPIAVYLGESERMALGFRILLRNSPHWIYEGEWRAVVEWRGPKGGGHMRKFPRHSLTGVVLGCRITADNERLVRKWAGGRSPAPAIYRAEMKQRKYGLQIVVAP